MLTFFYAPGTCSLASHITLEEVGATYDPRRLNFSASEQSAPAYLALNPKGRVPLLLTDRGSLTETPAILVYLAQTHPAAGLIPVNDPFALAQVQSFNSYLCSTVHVNHAHRPRGNRWADDASALDAMKKKVPGNMAACMALIEDNWLTGPWVMGETFSICDPYLYTIETWLEADGVDIMDYPKLAAHRARMEARPSVKTVLAREAA